MTFPFTLHLHHQRWAVFSDDHRYRYKLTRSINADLPAMGVVAHHPGAGGHHRNDDTVSALIDLAKSFGRGRFDLYNLHAGISTDAAQLAAMDDPTGPDNDAWLDQLAQDHDFILLTWGQDADPQRARTVSRRLWHAMNERAGTLAVLGWTTGDNPQPARITSSTQVTALQSLTATGDLDAYTWSDPRWAQLVADTTDLDTDRPTRSRRFRRAS
ncbi:DUF1643 domain-containing protein [Mycolicibacterium llatzerense]|uniref:DUF1643 domain-containing protein n=1 Tax=Mycolicibacterium llatzerense TaxID=280871 RepID=UPI0021B5A215|nr:DUF1643 domain-containing protein [Mycolicibacterium llatzerense]MCT7373011.1 hypothetical protein [Mycolicibacterium llatzerense]